MLTQVSPGTSATARGPRRGGRSRDGGTKEYDVLDPHAHNSPKPSTLVHRYRVSIHPSGEWTPDSDFEPFKYGLRFAASTCFSG